MVGDPQKPKIAPLYPPMDPIWSHFVGILGQFGVKKHVFLKKKFAQNHFLSVPRWSGTLKNRKLPLYTPQWSPNDIYWVPRWSGTLKKPNSGLLHPPSFGHLLSPRIPLGLAKSSALFKP